MGYNREAPHAFRCECGDHSWARLSRGYVVLVSPEDEVLLLKQKYTALPKPPKNQPKSKVHHRVTVMHSIKGRGTATIHREIMQPDDGMVIDHANRNCLDNRRGNLRVCTVSQNGANSRKPQGKRSSKYKGVSWSSTIGKWRAAYELMGKCKFIGNFDCEETAHAAYIKATTQVWGEFARAS
jgi:hypothetical protein